jgi:3-deoxy-D-manno-octulosonate 8-phosphate phosphatase (KDO 8-P phosphatase)
MHLLDRFKKIKCFLLDVDGVLTNGTILLLGDGQQARSMNIKDGYALQLAIKKGYKVAIISGGDSSAVAQRLNKLGVQDVFLKVENKWAQVQRYLMLQHLTIEEALFMGDDLPDYEVMQQVGLPCCPADAVTEIKNISTYTSIYKGGEGCVRDVIEKVLQVNNHWDATTSLSSF